MQALMLTTAVLLFIVFRCLIPLWGSGPRRQFWAGAVFLAVGYALLALACFDIYTPGLMKPVDSLVRWLFGL